MRGSRGDVVFVILGRETPVDERDGDHVLDAVVAVGGIVERAGLVDDALPAFLRFDDDALDFIATLHHAADAA